MKDCIGKVIQEDSDLHGHQFHELSVPILKDVINRAIDILMSQNRVVFDRLSNPSSQTGLDKKAKGLWLRQLLLMWFTKQFTNRRTERLKLKKKMAKCEICSGCGGNLKCTTCDGASCEIELVTLFIQLNTNLLIRKWTLCPLTKNSPHLIRECKRSLSKTRNQSLVFFCIVYNS